MSIGKRIAWTVTALFFGLSGWVPFLYLALSRKDAADRRNLAMHGVLSAGIFAAMLAVADQRDNISAVVGLAMCAAAIGAAVHAWVELGKNRGRKDDTVQVTTGRAYL